MRSLQYNGVEKTSLYQSTKSLLSLRIQMTRWSDTAQMRNDDISVTTFESIFNELTLDFLVSDSFYMEC